MVTSAVAPQQASCRLLVMTAHLEAEAPLPHAGMFRKPFDTAQLLATVERLHAARSGATWRGANRAGDGRAAAALARLRPPSGPPPVARLLHFASRHE